MLQLILGYTFATILALTAVAMFVAIFHEAATTKRHGIINTGIAMFIICAGLSVFFAWAAGV